MSSELPQTMRACQWSVAAGGLENNIKVNNNAPLPKGSNALGKDQTLVKVAYTALNPVDYKLPELPIIDRLVIKKPATPCLDFSGTVAATGRTDLKPGQRVFGSLEPLQQGAAAEYVIVGREGVAPLPDSVKLRDAGCVGVAGLTAYQGIILHAKEGDKVFINGGSGGTGTFGIQFAKATGCYVVTSCSGPNVDLCKSLGADEVIDYKSENIVQTLKRKGTQFDLIVDNVGSPELYWQSHHYLKPSGKVLVVGLSPRIGLAFEFLKIFLWPQVLGGGQRKIAVSGRKSNAEHLKHIGEMMAEGKVKSIIGQLYDLEDVPKAIQRLKAGGFQGKLAVQVSEEVA